MKILVTGSSGLIGTELRRQLHAAGHQSVPFDCKLGSHMDVRSLESILSVLGRQDGIDGIVHLAACSRVLWAQHDPTNAIAINVMGTMNVLNAAAYVANKPWMLFASSREVYGRPIAFPIYEQFPMLPINTYGRTKALGEDMVNDAGRTSLKTGIIRLSSVYGSTTDHADRVVPAFARRAAFGGAIDLIGPNKTFDYVHVTDAARGLVLACERLAKAEGSIPTIHLTTGDGTPLTYLARLAREEAAAAGLTVTYNASHVPRGYEVEEFVGYAGLAEKELGWKAEVKISDGFRRLVADYRAQGSG